MPAGDTADEDMPVHHTRMISGMNDVAEGCFLSKYPARPLLPNLTDMSDNRVYVEDSPLWWAITP